jgi:exopolyphosphatase/guanosine-5'-triphosphate,3'-diphosphate pyrophosphatase
MNGDTRLRDGLAPRAGPAGSAAAGGGAPTGLASGPGLYAALDLGTNNCRLLIACPAGDGFRVIDSFSRIIRLGEGVSATGRISEAAMPKNWISRRLRGNLAFRAPCSGSASPS